MYMVPPFIAYYGALTGNKTLLDQAYDQVKLYRGQLMDKKMGGLWKHVLLGPSANDPGYWSTGASRASSAAASGHVLIGGMVQGTAGRRQACSACSARSNTRTFRTR